MADYTSNLGMKKPSLDDDALVTDINNNMDILDTAVNGIQDGLAIVANNNTHVAISAGQFVYVRNHSTLAEGLYVASSNIAANATLSTSNLTADSAGGLNALNSKIVNIGNIKLLDTVDNVQSFDITIPSLSVHFLSIGSNNMSNVCLLFVNASTVGTITYAEVYKGTYINITVSTNKITISTTDTRRRFYVYDLCMRGDNASL